MAARGLGWGQRGSSNETMCVCENTKKVNLTYVNDTLIKNKLSQIK